MATLATPTRGSGTPQAPTLEQQASPLFTGQPAPYLPQILQPIPDPMVLQSQFESMFPNADLGDPYAYYNKAQEAIAGLPPIPQIQTPTVAPVQVAIPGGTYQNLAQAQYEGQFQPVQRELERREAQQQEALQAQLAQTGLASSGTGIGQQQRVSREFSEQIGAASSAISEQAQARALEAQLTVATQQANIDIQRNLANAQLSYASQNANARNILEFGASATNALVQALGLDAQRTEVLRGQFLQYVDSQTRAALGQSEVARAALADIFNALLQQDAIDQRTEQFAQEMRLRQSELNFQEDNASDQLALGYEQLASNERIAALQKQKQEAGPKDYSFAPGTVTSTPSGYGYPPVGRAASTVTAFG